VTTPAQAKVAQVADVNTQVEAGVAGASPQLVSCLKVFEDIAPLFLIGFKKMEVGSMQLGKSLGNAVGILTIPRRQEREKLPCLCCWDP